VFVDSLSRKYEDQGTLFSLSFIVVNWLQVILQSWFQNLKLYILIQHLQQDPQASPWYSWNNDELRYKGHAYLRKQSNLKSIVLFELHSSPTTGNLCFTKTNERVKRFFCWNIHKYWEGVWISIEHLLSISITTLTSQ